MWFVILQDRILVFCSTFPNLDVFWAGKKITGLIFCRIYLVIAGLSAHFKLFSFPAASLLLDISNFWFYLIKHTLDTWWPIYLQIVEMKWKRIQDRKFLLRVPLWTLPVSFRVCVWGGEELSWMLRIRNTLCLQATSEYCNQIEFMSNTLVLKSLPPAKVVDSQDYTTSRVPSCPENLE